MREPIAVPHPFLSVVGGLTPDMLTTLPEKHGRDDGFLARLLFSYPERQPLPYSEEGISPAVEEAWDDLAAALWARPMPILDGKPTPSIVAMSPEARDEWVWWCRGHREEQEA